MQDNCNEMRGLISQAADRASISSKGSAFPSENSHYTKYEQAKKQPKAVLVEMGCQTVESYLAIKEVPTIHHQRQLTNTEKKLMPHAF